MGRAEEVAMADTNTGRSVHTVIHEAVGGRSGNDRRAAID